MKKWKSILLLSLVFLAGIVVGAVGTRTIVRHVVQRAINQPERVQEYVERDLNRKLRLDEAQRDKLHGILTESRGQWLELHRQYQPQVLLVLSNADGQISAMLTSEQLVRYQKFKESNRTIFRPLHQSP